MFLQWESYGTFCFAKIIYSKSLNTIRKIKLIIKNTKKEKINKKNTKKGDDDNNSRISNIYTLYVFVKFLIKIRGF